MTTGESFLDIDTSDAIEPALMEDGTENLIRIIGYNKQDDNIVRESDSGYKHFLVLFDFPNEIAAKSFPQIYSIPTDPMDEKQTNRAKWELELLKRAFQIEGGINFEEIVGNEGWAIIGKKDENKGFGEQNYIKKLLAGN